MMGGRRGAPRSEAARIAILEATASRFAEHGYEHLTIEGIAAQAGVGKQTIYRWWKTKTALVAECLLEGMLLPGSFIPPDTGDLGRDLTGWVEGVLRFIDDPDSAELMHSLLAAAAIDEQIGRMLRDALAGDSALSTRLESAAATGDLAPGTPLRELGDALVGGLVLRVICRTPTDMGSAARFVGALLGPQPHRSGKP